MHDIIGNFINLDAVTILYLFAVGFVGGLVSGFIGSGGAFVLTPGMMSLGVPGLMAVASNMCHKFPKALVGAMKRFKYGQVDVKLGVILGVSAEAGVLYGATIQERIKACGILWAPSHILAVLAMVRQWRPSSTPSSIACCGGLNHRPRPIRFFFACSTPLRMASGTSFAFPRPYPT